MPTYVTIPQAKALILEHIGGRKIFPSTDVNIQGTQALRERPSASPAALTNAIAASPAAAAVVSNITANTNPATASREFIRNPVESFTSYVKTDLPTEFNRSVDFAPSPAPRSEKLEAVSAASAAFSVLLTGVEANTALINHTDIMVGRTEQSNSAPYTFKTVFEADAESESIRNLIPEPGLDKDMVGSVMYLIDPTYTPKPVSGAASLGRGGDVEQFNNLSDLTTATNRWLKYIGDGSQRAFDRALRRSWINELQRPIAELRRRTSDQNMIQRDQQIQQTVANKVEVISKVAAVAAAQTQQGSTSILSNTGRLLTPAAAEVVAGAKASFLQEEAARAAADAASAPTEVTAAPGFEYVNGQPVRRFSDGSLYVPPGQLPPPE